MSTKTTAKATATETKKEFKLEQAFAMWKNKSKDGKKTYLSSNGLIGFYNTKKKNPKEPDLRVYYKDVKGEIMTDDEGKEIVVCSLWCNVSEKTKKKYLTGTYEGQKVVGFINESKNEKAPYLSVYYREDGELTKPTETTKKKYEEVETDNDLPF